MAGDLTVPARRFWPAVDYLRARGFDPDEVLAPTGYAEARLRAPDLLLPRAASDRIIDRLVQACPEPGLGMRVAAHVGSTTFDVIEYAARSSATLGDAVRLTNRFAPLADAQYHFWVEAIGERRLWRFKARSGSAGSDPRTFHVYTTEFRIGSLQVIGRRVFGRKVPLLEIWLDWPDPAAPGYLELFDAPVRFDAPFVAVVFSAETFDLPLPGHDPALFAVLERFANAQLAHVRGGVSLPDQVKDAIVDMCPRGEPSLGEVATLLGTTPWTLRRRLRAEGLSYHALLAETRREVACACLLDPRMNLAAIAYRVGFRDESSFFKSFRRWTGKTPTAYRRDAHASG